jgi:hypothetical protein
MKPIVYILTLIFIASTSLAGEFKVFIEQSGSLSWTNSVSNAYYQIEWKSDLNDNWRTGNPFLPIHSNSNSISTPIPMYFRVVAKYTPEAACFLNLARIDDAKAKWIIETSPEEGTFIQQVDILPYIDPLYTNSIFQCPLEGDYYIGQVGADEGCQCTYHGTEEWWYNNH